MKSPSPTRYISWFSCGAASAVATKIALVQYPDTEAVYCLVENEHPDNLRFLRDCGAWLGVPVKILQSPKYKDCWEVWEKTRYLNGVGGARCTVEMKKKVRQAYQRPDDVQFFGFTVEEASRALRFRDNNLEVNAVFPLIDQKMTKEDCFREIQKAGLEPPMMYRLGYKNANCIGCVKGGMGYWNKIRKDFPEVFSRMADLETQIGATCIKGQPLRTLDPERGRHEDLSLPECGFFCGENIGQEATSEAN